MRLIRTLFASTILLIMLGGLAAAGGWMWLQNEAVRPGPGMASQEFVVEQGETLVSVATRLEEAGHVRNGRIMRLVARLDGGALIKAGTYNLPAGQSVRETLEQLVAGEVELYRVTIPEGLTSEQIMRLLDANEGLTGELPETPAEGTLLPDTYFVAIGASRQDVVDIMREAQVELLETLWPRRQEGLPISSPEEAIILASVVEKETGSAGERGEIAGVFTSRLKRGMRLESDPTIIYGISRGERLYNAQGQRRTLYRSEIDRKTDWNTYQIDGLPKTAICNPGRDAIAAVLDPPETENIFFVADGEGGHVFADNLTEHNRNVAVYRRIERQRIAAERAN